MERWLKWVRDFVMVGCALISTWYLIYSEKVMKATAVDATISISPPWWVIVIGLLAIALLLTRWLPVLYRWHGFKFFPDRAALQRAEGTLSERLSSVSNVSALWVMGHKYFVSGSSTRVVKRLLVPNPDSESFKHFVKTIPHTGAGDVLRETTKTALQAGTKVRWYEGFISHSIILADVNKSTGWMHIESVFPYSKSEYRPSYTVHKRHSPEAVAEMQRIFEELWEQANTPNKP